MIHLHRAGQASVWDVWTAVSLHNEKAQRAREVRGHPSWFHRWVLGSHGLSRSPRGGLVSVGEALLYSMSQITIHPWFKLTRSFEGWTQLLKLKYFIGFILQRHIIPPLNPNPIQKDGMIRRELYHRLSGYRIGWESISVSTVHTLQTGTFKRQGRCLKLWSWNQRL